MTQVSIKPQLFSYKCDTLTPPDHCIHKYVNQLLFLEWPKQPRTTTISQVGRRGPEMVFRRAIIFRCSQKIDSDQDDINPDILSVAQPIAQESPKKLRIKDI